MSAPTENARITSATIECEGGVASCVLGLSGLGWGTCFVLPVSGIAGLMSLDVGRLDRLVGTVVRVPEVHASQILQCIGHPIEPRWIDRAGNVHDEPVASR